MTARGVLSYKCDSVIIMASTMIHIPESTMNLVALQKKMISLFP